MTKYERLKQKLIGGATMNNQPKKAAQTAERLEELNKYQIKYKKKKWQR